MKYHVSVGGRNVVVEVDGDVVRVEGTEVAARVERVPGHARDPGDHRRRHQFDRG